MDVLTTINTRRTPQSEKAHPDQVKNAAGGYTFQIGDDARIHRFLTIGTTGGTYYTSERELTKTNADVVINVARTRGSWLVEQIVQISTAGRAPKQNPAIFALAIVSALGDEPARQAAFAAVPTVCRTASTLFLFIKYREQFGGWGRGMCRAIDNWYLDKDVDSLAYQMVKYRQREGWTHRDVLRQAHPETTEQSRKALFNWAVSGQFVWVDDKTQLPVAAPDLVQVFEKLQKATDVATWTSLIEAHPVSWEMLPDIALKEPAVWRALIEKGMPQTALMRQLPRLTNLGVLEGDTARTVVNQLQDENRLRKGRVHPVNVLIAARTYSSGKSARGSSSWTPNRKIIDALDGAFYKAFAAVEPAGKRTLLALDVSGSMGFSNCAGLMITPREASAALALVTLATEPECDVVGFTGGGYGYHRQRMAQTMGDLISELSLSPRQRLDDAINAISNLPFGGTDCSLPMLWAAAENKSYDTFAVYTDNETWAGNIHPHQALAQYRQHTGIQARQIVVGMTATECSIADPTDPLTLDIAGMDSAVPNLIADFSRGSV